MLKNDTSKRPMANRPKNQCDIKQNKSGQSYRRKRKLLDADLD